MDLVEDNESDSRKRMVLSFWVTALNISVRHYLGKAEIVEATAKKSSPIGFRPIATNLMKNVEVPKVQKSQAARPSKSANLSTENKVDTIWTEKDLDNAGFANVVSRYPTLDELKSTSGLWNFFKTLKNPVEKKNILCLVCARLGTVTLLSKPTTSTYPMSQHLEHMHKEDHKAFQMNSSRSLFSSQSVKEFKESTAASHALQVTQGIVIALINVTVK
jgi:hypothetical protein